jgi:hypothetical protein
MSRTLLVSVALLFASLLAGAVLLWVGGNDTVEARYESYSEAALANAAAHGMVPDFLPRSASRIVAWRNLDLNIALTEFTYDPADFDAFLRQLPSTPNDGAPVAALPRGSEFDTSNPGKLDRFVVTERDGCTAQLVVNREQRRALYVYNAEPHVVGC